MQAVKQILKNTDLSPWNTKLFFQSANVYPIAAVQPKILISSLIFIKTRRSELPHVWKKKRVDQPGDRGAGRC